MGHKSFDEISHYNPMKVIKNEKIDMDKEPVPIKYTLSDKIKMGF